MRIKITNTIVVEVNNVSKMFKTSTPGSFNENDMVACYMNACNENESYLFDYELAGYTIEEAKQRLETDMEHILKEGWLDMSDVPYEYDCFDEDDTLDDTL